LTSYTETDPAYTAKFNTNGAANGDLLMFNSTTGKYEKFTPNYSVNTHIHANATTSANGFMSSTDKTKLDGIAAGAEVNVNADWNATSGDAQLLNKPDLSVYATKNMANQNITNLANPVNAQDATTKAYVDVLLQKIEALEAREESYLVGNGFTDLRDNNHYNVVKIGDQVWMAENLRYLPSVFPFNDSAKYIPRYYVYGYNGTVVADAKASSNYSTYGVSYNWAAAMNGDASSNTNPSGVQGICPEGWHLPSKSEWVQLSDYLGGGSVAGGKLKEAGTSHWNSPNTGATNETGFNALPAGIAIVSGFSGIRNYTIYWSSNSYAGINGINIAMLNYNSEIFYPSSGTNGAGGSSVRCLKD